MPKAQKLLDCITINDKEKLIDLDKINKISNLKDPIKIEDWINFYEPIFLSIKTSQIYLKHSKMQLFNESGRMDVVLKSKKRIFKFENAYSPLKMRFFSIVNVYYPDDNGNVYFSHSIATNFNNAIDYAIDSLKQQIKLLM